MLRLLLRRLGWTLPVLLLVSVIMFLLMHAVPGSPWDRQGAGRAMTMLQTNPLSRATLDRRYGLDLPLGQQFIRYIAGYTDADGRFRCGAICGNLGPSYRQFGRTVEEILFEPPEGRPFWESRAGYSLRLGFYAFVFALVAGVPLGILAAVRQNRPLDVAIRVLTAVGVAIPNFVLGLLLIIVLGSGLGFITLLPGSWATAGPRTWVVPIVVLGFGTLTSIARLTRASLLETMRQDYVRTARAKGLREQSIITVHVLKNALIPIITMLAPILAELVTGTFVVETMFGFPGIGREYVQAVGEHDYSMVMGATLLYAVFVVFSNLSVDVAYTAIDPRATVE
jgi:ABC-type dipeptide/oligopeptide/nickel transport system permease component